MNKKIIIAAFILIVLIILSTLFYQPFIKPLINKITGYATGNLGIRVNWPPTLIVPIPDLTWDEDTTWPNAFDLDDHFTDRNGDVLSYNVTGNSSIRIVIDPVTNRVSFSQPANWYGVEQVIFTADDGYGGFTESNVVNLTVEDVEELELPEVGGGRVVVSPIQEFSIFPESLNISIRQEAMRKITFKINNTGVLKIILHLNKTLELVDFGTKEKELTFFLDPGQQIEQNVYIRTSLDTLPDIYAGEIFAYTVDMKKHVPILIEVTPKIPSFEVGVKIPERYKEVEAGKDILAEISIYSLEEANLIDAAVTYDIMDSAGNVIASDQELVSLKQQTKFNKRIRLPKDAVQGDYIFYVRVDYKGKMGTGSDTFKIVKIEKPLISTWLLILILILLILLLLIIIIVRWRMIVGIKKRYEEEEKIP